MLAVLLLVFLIWIYSVAVSIMVLKGDFSPQQKETAFIGLLFVTASTFLLIGRYW